MPDVPNPVIVLAEDDPDVAMLVRRALRKLAPTLSVFHAKDGKVAMNRLEKTPVPALLVTDIDMPEMNGIQLIEWVRAETKLAPLPIVVFSGSENPQHQRQCEQLHVDRFIKKGASLGELCQRVRVLLSEADLEATDPLLGA